MKCIACPPETADTTGGSVWAVAKESTESDGDVAVERQRAPLLFGI
jgi:hypothetical protein